MDAEPEPTDEEMTEIKVAWKAELQRRAKEIDSGRIMPVPIEEMFRKSRERHPDKQ